MGYNQRSTGFTVNVGLTVLRPTAALPASTTAAIFNIVGGRVLVRQLLGRVTTVVQTQATTYKLQSNPTVAGSSVDLCATADLSAAPVGQLLGVVGVFATALQQGLAIVSQTTPFIVQAGTIDAVTVATSTGSIEWLIVYSPLDLAARVTAA